MIFGNETPFYLKPLPNRGLRRHCAESQQHYPGYRHPIDFSDIPFTGTGTTGKSTSPTHNPYTAAVGGTATGVGHPMTTTLAASVHTNATAFNPMYNITEAERVHPVLTATDRLRRDRETARQEEQDMIDRRRAHLVNRDREAAHRQRSATAAEEDRAARMAGTSLKNRESEGRSTITHQCYTAEAQTARDTTEAADRHRYFARQRLLEQRTNSTRCNVISWQPRPEIDVPPPPPSLTPLQQYPHESSD